MFKRRQMAHLAWIVTLPLASCAADAAQSSATPIDSVVASSPTSTSSGATVPSSTLAVTETAAQTTTSHSPEELGFDAASRLATAFADGDWTAARQLSPLPEWSDQTYEEGFAGLDAATMFKANSLSADDGQIDLWLAEVAHESTGGDHTTLYCVHWRFDPAAGTIERVSGEQIRRVSGFVDPSDLQNEGILRCPGFEQPEAPTTTVFELAPAPISPGAHDEPNLNGGKLVTFDGRQYVCFYDMFDSNVDCVLYYGGGASRPLFGSPDLRCTERSFSDLECTDDGYYPSDLDGLDVTTIDGQRVLCQFDECWLWPDYVDDPASVPYGPPDYDCDRNNRCTAV